jgi:hypothetical protein
MRLGQNLNFVIHAMRIERSNYSTRFSIKRQKERLTWKPEKCKEQASPLS